MSRTPSDIEPKRRHAAPFWRRLDLSRALVATTVVAIAAAGLQIALDLHQQRATAEAAAHASVRNLSLALARDIELTTAAIDSALVTIAADIAEMPDGMTAGNPATRAILQRNRALLMQEVRGIFLNDAAGLVIGASNPQAGATLLGTMQADRPYFSRLRDGAVSGLHIGPPVISRYDGTPVMILARRVNAPDGAFAGVVGATIAVYKLEDFYSRFDIPSSMVMSLWLSTGELIARRPAAGALVGQSVVNSVVPTLPANGTAATIVYRHSPIDGVARLSAFRRVANYPFVVGSAIAETDFLTAWRRQVVVSAMQLAIGGSLLLAVSILLAGAMRRRERLMDQLRDSENRFRDFAEIASDWLCELDSRLRFSYISGRREQITGEAPDRLLGRAAFEVVSRADVAAQREIFAEHHANLEAHREIRNFQFRATLANGQQRWVSINARPVFDADGAFAGYRCTVTDRTPQVVAQREALDANTRLKSAIESLPDGFAMFGRDDRLVQWNSAFAQFTGDRPSEATSFADFAAFLADHVVLPDALGATREAWLAELARRHRAPQEPFDIHFKDGRWIRIIEARTHEGGSVLLHADVTARRHAEDALARAQKLDALGQLTGGVAHDFNNLLTVIIGQAESLVDELAALPTQAKGAETIVTAALRGADLTRQLLAFARRQPLQLAQIDANSLIGELEHMLRRTLPEVIEIRVAPAPGLWNCLADRAQLENAILNLAINARDAMPDGGVLAIETANVTLAPDDVALYPEAATGDYVLVAVSDSGQGMPPEVLERVFEPFFTTKPAGHGTGLGLSMVYGFIKQCGGHIRIDSELDHGTTVKLYLRRADRSAAVATAPAQGMPRGHGETVLVVEDDDMVRDTTVARILHLGYRVLTAINGPAALQLLEQNAGIDLLLTDMVMPGGMTGLDLAIAARQRQPGLKVLIASGYAASAMAGRDPADPTFEMIGKPYRLSELAQRLHAALSRREPLSEDARLL